MAQESDPAAQKLPPGRHGLPRQFVLHNQRARLVEAATEVFGTRLYSEARVADVLELAAISRKTFYEQFRDKEDCFLAAYEAAAERAGEAIRSAARDEVDWAAQLYAGVDTLLNFLADEPQLARLLVVEVMGAGPAARKRRDQVIDTFESVLAGEGSGTNVAAQLVVGGFWEILHQRVSTGRGDELRGLTGEIADCALALIDEPDHAQAATG
jgi:AcrR family transcriptional regulator